MVFPIIPKRTGGVFVVMLYGLATRLKVGVNAKGRVNAINKTRIEFVLSLSQIK